MYYSKEQIDRANAVNLEEFLQRKGEVLTRSGNESRWKAHDSVTIKGNKWFRHSENKVFLRRILLHISSREYAGSFLFQQGFTAVGFLLLYESVLRFFMREKKEKLLSFLLSVSLCLFYHARCTLITCAANCAVD